MAIDRRERANQFQLAIDAAIAGLRADMWTAMPGIVQSYDAAKQTVSVQVAIQAQTQAQDGKWSNTTITVLPDVPVEWPSGGGFSLTFPLKKDDEGLVVFCSRCINAWWSQSGVQPQEELRMHDLSDGVFIPGLRSKPKVSNPAPSITTAQLRSDDGMVYVELAAGHIVNVVAPGGINLIGPVTITGPLALSGAFTGVGGAVYNIDIKTSGDVIAKVGAGQVGLSTHQHNQPNDSHGDIEPPTAGPTAGT